MHIMWTHTCDWHSVTYRGLQRAVFQSSPPDWHCLCSRCLVHLPASSSVPFSLLLYNPCLMNHFSQGTLANAEIQLGADMNGSVVRGSCNKVRGCR